MYEIHLISSASDKPLEQLGTKRKYWFLSESGDRFLFKAEERGTGEDWAEKVASEICRLLGIPHVNYELAREDWEGGKPGVICRSCSPEPTGLEMGNHLLFLLDPKYPYDPAIKYKVSQHTVNAVAQAVRTLRPPGEEWTSLSPKGITDALGFFIGYIMLDALVANTDRHHQNWAALRRPDGLGLAPTFDHGACLARNLLDSERSKRLQSTDSGFQIRTFATKARSAFYFGAGSPKPLTTLEAWNAFSSLAPSAAKTWLECLRRLENKLFEEILGQIPPARMSETTRSFTLRLLLTNKERLLETANHD